jgi:hypothetical protein
VPAQMCATRVLVMPVLHRICAYHALPGNASSFGSDLTNCGRLGQAPPRRAIHGIGTGPIGFLAAAVGWRSSKRPVARGPPRDEAGKKQTCRDNGRRTSQDQQNDTDCVRLPMGEDDQHHTGDRNDSSEQQKPPARPPKPATLPLQLRLTNRRVIAHQ